MKKFFMYMLPFLAVACSTEELENVTDSRNDSAQELQGVVMTISDFNWEGGTRISLTETEDGMAFSWVDGDVVGVYASKSMANFNIETIGSDAKSASFDGGGFSLTAGSTYYAFNPYNADGTNKAAVPVSYTGQIQAANTDASHLGAYDFMTSQATAYATNRASFNFAHLGSVMRMKLTVPAGINYQSLKITSPSTPFVTVGTVDLTAETPVITATETSNEITLGLDFTTSGETLLTLYAMVAPVDLSSSTLTLTLKDNHGGEYNAEVAGKNMLAGSAYGYECTFINEGSEDDGDIPYITFKADEEQTFKMSTAVATLEYSVNNNVWIELGTDTIYFGGENGILRLRGKSSVGTNGAQITFGNTTPVACSGDIRTLVDYENYDTVDTSEAIFKQLFKNCSQLSTAPELPAMDLTPNCYSHMFYGCSSLTTAPELPATSLYASCYDRMFAYCTSLREAPELPAMYLTSSCYHYMFAYCTSLQEAPELPANQTALEECYKGMFFNCSSLVTAPEVLPATTLRPYCYYEMFAGCSSLTKTPELPATRLAYNCYQYMFYGCTSLTSAPELPATNLESSCYADMFSGCTSLEIAPSILPAMDLAIGCYSAMFKDCKRLLRAPILPAPFTEGYSDMFYNCQKLNYIKMMAISIGDCIATNWVVGVPTSGTFVMNSAATWDIITGPDGIPEGWTVVTADE